MSKIYINYPCSEHPKEVITAKVAELLHKLEDKYGICHEFTEDNNCQLSGSGINGQVTMGARDGVWRKGVIRIINVSAR